MWLHEYIKVGTRVRRADNPSHHGVVLMVSGNQAKTVEAAQAVAVFRVLWDNGWREDCSRNELERDDC